ncbi:MAG: nucleotidyltransferase family protein [Gemmatimonadota bacterium]
MSRSVVPSRERPRKIAEQVAALARRVLGPGIHVYWFGSWAEGRAVERSDIDVGIEAEEPIPLHQLGRLRAAVEELSTLYTVDLLDLRAVDPALRERALSRGIRL